MKHFVILLFWGYLITSCCSAQSTGVLDPPKVITQRLASIAVTFITNDTCFLRINNGKNYIEMDGKNYIKIVKDRTISLPVGYYRLDFESLETGETIKNRSFQLIKDSIPGGRYNYPVTFK